MAIDRIAVIGISGSGKSTFARTLAKRTGLPLFHMDQLFWKGDWEAVPEKDYLERHRALVARERWIIEGYVDEAMAGRLSRADLVIYLDYPGSVCAWRIVKRWAVHRRRSRPELPSQARERLRLPFLWMVLRRGERPGIESALSLAFKTSVKRFRSPRELRRLNIDR